MRASAERTLSRIPPGSMSIGANRKASYAEVTFNAGCGLAIFFQRLAASILDGVLDQALPVNMAEDGCIRRFCLCGIAPVRSAGAMRAGRASAQRFDRAWEVSLPGGERSSADNACTRFERSSKRNERA